MLFVITWINEAGDYMLYVHQENEDDDICVTCALYEHDDEIMIEYLFYVHHTKFCHTVP
jgi:hypothetical protein